MKLRCLILKTHILAYADLQGLRLSGVPEGQYSMTWQASRHIRDRQLFQDCQTESVIGLRPASLITAKSSVNCDLKKKLKTTVFSTTRVPVRHRVSVMPTLWQY